MSDQLVAAKATRVVFFSSDDIIPNIVLNLVLPAMAAMGLEPLVFLTPLLVHKAPPPSLARMGFYEREVLHNLVFPELEAHAHGYRFKTFGQLRRQFGGFEFVERLDDPRVAQAFDHPQFLGAISAHNQLLFRGRHIDRIHARGGFLWNLHHGPLPDNRGLLAPFWNLLEGRTEHGVSLHEIDTGIDTGSLIATARLRLSPRQNILASMIDLGVPGAHLLTQTLSRVAGGVPITPLPQHHGRGIYRSYPTVHDIAQARACGIHLTGAPREMAALYADVYSLRPSFVADRLGPALERYETEWRALHGEGETQEAVDLDSGSLAGQPRLEASAMADAAR